MDVFGGAPRFLAYPRPVVVQSGTDAVLKCQISGDPRPAVIWERNNEKIHPEGRYRVFEDGNVYNLIITSVTKEDSGQYICKAKNCIGETYAAATLKVEGEAQEKEFREENKPRFLIKPLSTRVGRGEDAMFSCKLWGNPRPEVIWEKDGKKLNEIFESTHFTISYQDGGWFQLKIFKTRAPDGGVYTCKARNEFGESLAGAVLLVDAGPGHEDDGNRNGYTNGHWKAHQGKQRSGRQVATRLKDDLLPNSAKVKMFAVTEGKHAKFRCYVTGKPKPEILWRKDGRLILSGRRYLLYEDREGYFTLKVLYCKQQDNGVYVCSASNTAGQTLSAVHLIVKEPPVRFKQPLNDLQVWERDLAVLECEVPEDSVPITWYLEDRRLQPGAKYGMEEWGTKRRLTIRDIGVDDDGIYLCEMADGGRSIAEVAVKGTIVRKLPRKVDVLEGENAAFCVEVEEEEMDIHWYKDGTELRETHQTILKSFGRTHILVFVNTTPQDSGLVMFYVGRSKTSSQLRVKAARHCPPSCPIGVQINTERANAALLSWFPAQDSRKNPPSGYIIERQEVGSQEWLQCLTTDSATSVEILGDSVPCEADYRFRICSVNKYGRSGNVEFPRAVHLVPVARIQAPLQDALVPEGQDACFTIELSASVIGTWFLNGNQLQDDDRFSIRRSRTHQSLRIRGVRDTDNGAEITFIAYGIRDSAALYIQAPLVKFTPLSEMDRNKFVEVGNPIVLYCELSDPEAPVRWYKNGVELNSMEGLHIQSEGTMRRIVIQSADFSHSGVYSCDAIDDVIRFNVEVEAPPVRFSVLPEGERNKSIEAGSTIALQCELSDPLAQVSWYKDGAKLLPQSGLDFNSEGTKRELFVQSAEFYHSGVYSCKTRGDAVHFNVDVKAPPVRFSAVPEVKRRKCIEAGCPIILQCEISDSTAQVQWYKDGDQLLVESGVDIKSDDCMRTLSIQSAHPSHAGVYSCTTKDDVIKFQVEIRAEPVRFSAVPESEKNICTEAGGHFELHCKVSDPTVHVHWFHNNTQLQPETGLDIQSEGDARTLVVNPAEPSHSGLYRCETSDDSVQFTVDIKDPPVMFSTLPDTVKNQLVEADYSTDMQGEISDPNAKVCCYKDGVELVSKSQPHIKLECTRRTLAVKTAQPSNSGWYDCVRTGDVIQFNVQDKVPPPRFLADPEVEMTKCNEEMEPAALHYEISDPTPNVSQTKDEEVMLPHSEPAAEFKPDLELESKSEFEPESDPEIHSDASRGTLIIHSPDSSLFEVNSPKTPDDPIQFEMDQAELSHYEVFSGDTYDDSVQCTVDIKEEFLRRSGTEAEIRSEKENNKLTAERSGEGTQMSIPTTFRLTEEEPQPEPMLQPMLHPQLQPMLHPQLQPMLHPQLQPMLHPQLQPILQPQLQPMLQPQIQPMLQPQIQPMLQPQIQPQLQPQLQQLEPQLQPMNQKSTSISEDEGSNQIQESDLDQDVLAFKVDVEASRTNSTPICGMDEHFPIDADCSSVLLTESSDHTTQEKPISCQQDEATVISNEPPTQKEHIQSSNICLQEAHETVTKDEFAYQEELKAHPVRFSALPEIARNKFIEAGCPIILQCEISDPTAQVSWLKDGVKLQQDSGLDIQSEGTMKTMIIHSAELKHSGVYSCEAVDDRIAFKVDVAAPPVMFSAVPEIEKNKSVEAGWPVILQCEISDPTALVQWYKDGLQLLPQSGVYIKSQHTMRTLVIQSANVSHSGFYSCNTADGISEFFVDVKAPPVTFAYIPEDDLHRNIVEQDNLLLCCQVSRSDATAQWYKDGVELKSSNNVLIEAENTLRKMIILSAQLSDSGTYTCRAGDSALIFKVNVREPPVMIVYPKEDVHLDRYVPEEIVLSCELSRPNGKVTWFKDGQKLQESENIKLKTEGPYRRLKILRSGVEDSGEYVCDTADDSIFFNLNIKEPPVRIVSPSQSQMELCQQTSERMVLSCEISRPNATVRWYRDGLEVEESDSLILEVDGVYRRLIIPKPTVKDSAEYVCDTADDSVTFFVNIAEPPVRFIRPRKMTYAVEKLVGDIVVLECEVSRPNAEVSWKKDGEEIEENSNITITEDGTSRQITIQSAAFNDAGQYVCDARDDVMDFLVKIKDPPLKILRKADIETKRKFVVSDAIVLKCEISRANGVVSWLKDNEKVEGKEHFICEEEGTFRSLIVLSAELRDSGEYICDAQDDKVVFNVTVEEAPVSIVGNSEKPEHHILMTGDELILECEVSRVNAIVQWYCNGCLLQEDSRTHIESRETMRKLVISGLQTSDSGEYLCDATDDKMITRLTVQETPFKFIKKEERSNISAYEEDSVTLRAAVNRVNAPVKWQRGHDPIKGDRFHTTSDGNTHYLTINPLKRCDNGEYTCHVGSDEMHFSVHVKAMKVKFSKPLENVVGLKGRDVVLKCELYKSKGDVQWLKDSQEIAPNRHFTIRADGQVRSLTIHNVTEDDAGEYACESKDERTSAAVVVNIPRIVEFIAELHNITVMEGEDATFKCVVSPEDVKLAWFRNDQPISSNHKFNISSNGLCHMLHINNCQVSDSCMLTAKAEGVISRAILQVQEAQVVFTKSMDPVVAEEFAEATLEVEVSLETAEVQWMRQGVVIHPGSKFTLKQSGKKHSLTVHKLTLSDRGTYSCETLHDCTQAKLSVEPRKIKILKGLTEIQTYERETASFEVELSHSNVEGVWQKDGHALKNNNHCRMTAKGRAHSLTISNLTLDDTGTYIFSVENIRSLARLDVKEIPVSVLKKLEDIRQPEGSGVTLECELSRHNVDIKWTKNQVQLKPGKNHRIYSMGRKSFLQILKCELGDSGSYVCDAGEATTSCSVEIYERELEILQSLEDLDIQEDQNAVFMCEVSLDDVPGEWFKNGETIKPTSTIKIRQEGTKHFLLICNVKGDDSGEIKFVAKNVESTANLEVEALPANIVKPLQDKTALEKTRVILDCTLTNPRCSIRWYKGPNVILPSERFEICSEGCYRKLVIQQVLLEDEGTYSVQVGNYTSSARLTVEAQSVLMVQELQDVDVTAPADACFECEVSLPVAKAPTWTLKGETLHPGPKVVVEKMGTVHRLTLKQTSTDMCGIVCFIIGRAKSTANLRVISNH
ncbi:obscurin-like protein 1 isoform X10 [Rhinichthys klamathensis goyatoka]|uniref:obscurin-like protein 1 isoform X10 n=1 Tax=Rhinichthys klamathensis goyatoka TaxID=3034132 RepID=UPI0024B62204|nr:obscurin-like protein 1 isoform X10 [Rhinichthys klamathensis goyatoka]